MTTGDFIVFAALCVGVVALAQWMRGFWDE